MSAPISSERQVFAGPRDLILASTSPYRRTLLERLGIPFRSMAPTCDESASKAEEPDPIRLAERLAQAKAASLAEEQADNAAIIGCDQLLAVQGQIFGKPGSVEGAIEQLLSGRPQS